MRPGRRAAVVVAAVFACGAMADAASHVGEPMRLQVTPSVSRAPADVTVRVTVEPAADNRLLRVVAESAEYYRSSEMSVDGANTSPLNVFEFRNLPPGLYQITSTLTGVRGIRGNAIGLLKVERAVGSASR